MAKIMIVDDSDLSRRILRSILEADGHQVVEESDGLAALERYFLEQPELVVLDMTMKGMHGLEVLSKLRSMKIDARVIVGSADIQESTRELTTAAGARAFVQKPFTAEKVLPAVNAALR